MKKHMKIFSVVLSVLITVSALHISVFAVSFPSRYTPAVFIPGIFQTVLYDADEEIESGDMPDDAIQASLDLKSLIARAGAPLFLSLLTRQDVFLSKAVLGWADDYLNIMNLNNDGFMTESLIPKIFPYSMDDYSSSEYYYVCSILPIRQVAEKIGWANTYCFAYNYFLSPVDNAKELHDFIQLVKQQTGSEKVNLIPVSQGGTVANAYLGLYGSQDISKVVYYLAAVNGSEIVSDCFFGRYDFSNQSLYCELLRGLIQDEASADFYSMLARLFPKKVLCSLTRQLVSLIIEKIGVRSGGLISLVPHEYYQQIRDAYLANPSLETIRQKADTYYQIQSEVKNVIHSCRKSGTLFYAFSGYGNNLISVVDSSNTLNGDLIVSVESSSIGAYSVPDGLTMDKSYAQKNIYCKNSEHNHISPDHVIDASCGFLPDTTWYFKGQCHLTYFSNDIMNDLLVLLVSSDIIQDVYTDERYPQFNVTRNVRPLKRLVNMQYSVDRTSADAEQLARLDSALDRADQIIYSVESDAELISAAEAELTDVYRELGVYNRKENSALQAFCKMANLLTNLLYVWNI